MRDMIKTMFSNTLMAIGISFTLFCIIAMGFDIGYGGEFALHDYGFTKMVVGALIIGIGFGAPTVVYSSDRLPMPMKVIIHMGTGLIIYFIVASYEGWMGDGSSTIRTFGIVVCQIAITFGVWAAFMLHYRREAKRMNDAIQKMNCQNTKYDK